MNDGGRRDHHFNGVLAFLRENELSKTLTESVIDLTSENDNSDTCAQSDVCSTEFDTIQVDNSSDMLHFSNNDFLTQIYLSSAEFDTIQVDVGSDKETLSSNGTCTLSNVHSGEFNSLQVDDGSDKETLRSNGTAMYVTDSSEKSHLNCTGSKILTVTNTGDKVKCVHKHTESSCVQTTSGKDPLTLSTIKSGSSQCNKVTKITKSLHVQQNSDCSLPLVCTECGRKYKQRSSLYKHMRSNHSSQSSTGSISCNEVGCSFYFLFQLRQHLYISTTYDEIRRRDMHFRFTTYQGIPDVYCTHTLPYMIRLIKYESRFCDKCTLNICRSMIDTLP